MTPLSLKRATMILINPLKLIKNTTMKSMTAPPSTDPIKIIATDSQHSHRLRKHVVRPYAFVDGAVARVVPLGGLHRGRA